MKKTINELKLTVPSKSINESFCRAATGAFAAQCAPTVEELSDIKTAVSEAVTNCIVHAYGDTSGNIYINARLFENGELRIKIRDTGRGIDDIEKAMEPLYTTEGGERSGLGFTVMESFMDKISVRSAVGKGTVVTMTKYISGKDSG